MEMTDSTTIKIPMYLFSLVIPQGTRLRLQGVLFIYPIEICLEAGKIRYLNISHDYLNAKDNINTEYEILNSRKGSFLL